MATRTFTAQKAYLEDKNGNVIFPMTHTTAVIDSQGNNIGDILNNLDGYEDVDNKVVTISSSSTDTEYPSAKAVYDALATKQDTIVFNTAYNASSNKAATMSDVPTVPTISTDIASDATSDTKTASPKAVKTFVEGKGYTTNTGTVTGIKVGTTDYSPSSGVVSIPAYPSVPVTDVTVGGSSVVSNGTAAVPAIPTVPTISTDIATDKSSTTKTASPSAVYAEVHPAIATTQPAGGFLSNVVYDLGTLTGTVTFALASASDNTIPNPYHWTFETGSTAPTVNWPANITWLEGSAPTVSASCHYEILIRNGYGTALEFDIS